MGCLPYCGRVVGYPCWFFQLLSTGIFLKSSGKIRVPRKTSLKFKVPFILWTRKKPTFHCVSSSWGRCSVVLAIELKKERSSSTQPGLGLSLPVLLSNKTGSLPKDVTRLRMILSHWLPTNCHRYSRTAAFLSFKLVLTARWRLGYNSLPAGWELPGSAEGWY